MELQIKLWPEGQEGPKGKQYSIKTINDYFNVLTMDNYEKVFKEINKVLLIGPYEKEKYILDNEMAGIKVDSTKFELSEIVWSDDEEE